MNTCTNLTDPEAPSGNCEHLQCRCPRRNKFDDNCLNCEYVRAPCVGKSCKHCGEDTEHKYKLK